ncbi:response regulator transcription factor [Acinetobacter populi]|jgi:DNA-binding response OmpR family regulator/DNA-binding CsgD family transcriptional regulator|uniref:DNA-binding response regulator n=1 Tax=Acinetobacter populi TaxID=1582270 RepID=A0A1Z9Z2C5_9GAMM|nr:response regulator transcription factor [Acinetobacter populi]MCH4246994.1 response regulator transcription factor [Acinetobacter populi]OUY08648.1 DNA-binding response regulator [Acinetobacter populi]
MKSPEQPVILIVDDVPENLGILHESLDEAGYTVLVTLDGITAIEIAHQYHPDIILMDGNMPNLDGFECCIQLKASPLTQNIPIIFMTGLSETEHIVRGFQSGGVDYVTKPLNIAEVLVRVQTHLNNATLLKQQQQVIDATEIAILALDHAGHITWKTAKAQHLINEHLIDMDSFEQGLKKWVADIQHNEVEKSLLHCRYSTASQQFQLIMLSPQQDLPTQNYLVQLKPIQQAPATTEILKHCTQLTPREAEVMHWLILGKTNKDIADILELSPRTINKHLEHVFEKLCVETRTAAVSYVVNRCMASPTTA